MKNHRARERPAPRGPTSTNLVAIVLGVTLLTGLGLSPGTTAQPLLGVELDGTVQDTTGVLLSDVTVILKRQASGSTWQYHETRTDANGAYSLDDVEPGEWNLTLQKDGYRTNHTTLDLAATEPARHDGELRPLHQVEYSGVVRDSETEDPIQGASIRVRSWTNGDLDTRNTTSDEDGAFRIALFPRENTITITKNGYGTWHDWVYPAGKDIHNEHIFLWPVPSPDAVVTGQVVDAATGAGVQALVNMRPDWNSAQETSPEGTTDAAAPMAMPVTDDWHGGGSNYNSTVTDEQGRFRMDAYAGFVTVEANRADYLIARTNAELQKDGTTELTLEVQRLPERTVTLGGTVTNAKNGSVLAGASVSVQVPAAGDYAWAYTDEDGDWEVTVRPGYTLVEVHHWGGHHDYGEPEPAYAEEMDAAEDAPGGSSSGSSAASSPAKGDASSDPVAEPAPEPVPPHDGTRFHPAARSITTQADSAATLDVALHPQREPTTTITGYVVDTDTEQGISGVHVSIQNHETGAWGGTTTDSDGSYRFQTHEGYHTLRIHKDGYLPAAVNTIAPGSGTHRVDIDATPGEWVQEGWWHPGDGDDGHHYGSPGQAPMDAGWGYGEESDAASMDRASGSPIMDGFVPSGGGSIRGQSGGLGPYTGPQQEESGAPAALLVVGLIGLIAAAMRRRR